MACHSWDWDRREVEDKKGLAGVGRRAEFGAEFR